MRSLTYDSHVTTNNIIYMANILNLYSVVCESTSESELFVYMYLVPTYVNTHVCAVELLCLLCCCT